MLLAAAPAGSLAAERDARHPGPLPWRAEAGLPFTVDVATFPESASTRLEIYVRIPPITLGSAVADSFGSTRIGIHTRLRGGNGRVQERDQVVTSTPADSATGFGKVVVIRYDTRPGTQHLNVRITDLNSRKRGLIYMGRQVTNAEEMEGDIVTPKPLMNREVSDLEFLWTGAGASAADSSAGDLPNPERLYGLFDNGLTAQFSARSTDERAWHWVTRVTDHDGHALIEHDSTSAPAREVRANLHLDVSTLPAGGYDLELKAWQEGDRGAVVRRSHFSVAWKTESWTANPADLLDAIHLLLTAENEDAFHELEPGEREKFLFDYWQARDPTPGTAENEAFDDFVRRIDYANRTYTRPGLQKGMFSDMGRVYIRYGQPDEVLHQVIPAGDETLSQVLDDIERTENRPADDVRRPGLGGDIRPYEVWIYEGVVPTPLEADPRNKGAVRRRKLTFLFVDEQGLGQYTLRYSTE
jgi:GWxTD domain-containing protein